MEEWVAGWLAAWMNERRSGRSPVRYSQRMQTTQRWLHMLRIFVGRRNSMEHRDSQRNNYYMYVSALMCEWSVISAWKQTWKGTPPHETVAHRTSCQRKYYQDSFGFHLLVMEVVLEGWKVFIPYNFILHRGKTLRSLQTHIHLFKSLKNTSAIGFGVNMVWEQKEDASFKKCRITLLQPLRRGRALGYAVAQFLQTLEHPAWFLSVDSWWWWGERNPGEE